MFELKFRITDCVSRYTDIEEEGGIEGFFEIRFDGHIEGYCHFDPLGEYEVGGEWIDTWLDFLLNSVTYLSLNNYVAFIEIETVNRWIEFRKKSNNIIINVAEECDENNNDIFVTTPPIGLRYIDPKDSIVDYYSFRTTILKSATDFIAQLTEINPQIIKTKRIKMIVDKIAQLTRT